MTAPGKWLAHVLTDRVSNIYAHITSTFRPNQVSLGAYIKYVGGGPGGFYKFFKKIFRSPGDHRPKYFKAQ